MNKIEKKISDYYSAKLKEHGPTPKGVDWNGEESQFIRFQQIAKIINKPIFTINDLGCGYGKFLEFLEIYYKNFDYIGYDLSEEMIRTALGLYARQSFQVLQSNEQIRNADFTVASGIFSVKMDCNDVDWNNYILETLNAMHEKSKVGFAFNMLTKYSDSEYMRADLYYADPLKMFDLCKRKYSGNVALLHDYDLYEFTILVRK